MEKLKALWAVFRQGEAVANPKAWKSGQISVTMLAGLFIAIVQLAKAFGYEVPVDNETATAIAGGVLAATNVVLTVVSSDKVGLPAAQQALPSVQQTTESAASREDVPHEPVSNVEHSGIDEDTRRRAEQFVRQQQSRQNNIDANDA